MSGPWYEPAVARFGRDFVDHNIDIWTRCWWCSAPTVSTGRRTCAPVVRAELRPVRPACGIVVLAAPGWRTPHRR